MKKIKVNKLSKKKYFFKFLLLSTAPILFSTIVASCISSPEEKNQDSSINKNLSSIDQKSALNIIKNPNFFKDGILDLSSFQNLKEIGNNSFSDISINKIIFPNNLQTIGTKAFFNAKNLSNLTFPKSLVEIKSSAFDGSGIENIDLTDNLNLKNIEINAFNNNENLKITIKHDSIKDLLKKSGVKDTQIIHKSEPNSSNPIDTNPQDPNKPSDQNNKINYSGLLKDKVLQTDSYLPVVETLDLNNLSTKLSDLTNEKLNSLLHKNSLFSDLNLSIVDGSSELIGILKLNLTGKYKDKNIPKNTIISVSNFFTYNQFNNFYLDFVKIDDNLYFQDLQTINNLSDWNSDKWIKYASSFNIVAKNNPSSSLSKEIDLKKPRFLDDFNLNFQYQSNLKKVQISGSIAQKEFNKNTWNPVDSKKIIQINKNSNSSSIDVRLPDKNDAINYFVNNQITLNSEDASYKQNQQLYPSEFEQKFSRMLNGNGLEKILLKFPESYIEYLKNNYDIKKPEIKINALYANDFNGQIFFNYALYDSQYSDSSELAIKSSSADGFKQINSFLEESNNEIRKNSFNITGDITDDKGNSKKSLLWEYAKKEILKNYSIEDLKNLSSTPEIISDSNPIFLRSGNSKTINLIRSKSENQYDQNTFESYDKYFGFKIFGYLIRDKFDFNTGIFDASAYKGPSQKFKIYSLHGKILDNTKAEIKKSTNSYYYSVNFVYDLELANANDLSNNTRMVRINASYSIHFLGKDLGVN